MGRFRSTVLILFLAFAAVAVNGDGDEGTCEALKKIASETVTANCSTNKDKDCDTVLCVTQIPSSPRNLDVKYNITILPCNKPPAVEVVLTLNDIVVVNQIFTANGTAMIAPQMADLQVTVIQSEGQIGLGMSINELTSGNTTEFVKYTEVPIKCKMNGDGGDGGDGDKGPETTCEALKKIASETATAMCNTNKDKDCDAVLCATQIPSPTGGILVVKYNITILPCNKPPAVEVVLTLNNTVTVNQTFTANGTATVVPQIADLQVTVIQSEGQIGLGMSINELTSGNTTEFVKYTEVPIKCKTDASGSIGVKGELLLIALLAIMLALCQLN